ncbi:hypothetical protein A2U01_0113530, partial [Trifolium medium]|nr:hypothetical protein [Trifolium medium]
MRRAKRRARARGARELMREKRKRSLRNRRAK